MVSLIISNKFHSYYATRFDALRKENSGKHYVMALALVFELQQYSIRFTGASP
jgi:hypothetical protein